MHIYEIYSKLNSIYLPYIMIKELKSIYNNNNNNNNIIMIIFAYLIDSKASLNRDHTLRSLEGKVRPLGNRSPITHKLHLTHDGYYFLKINKIF